MLVYIAKRLVFVIPVVFAVALVCFLLVHIAPGDPLVSVLPPDASQALADQMRKAYGFDRPLPVQFASGCGMPSTAISAPRSLPAARSPKKSRVRSATPSCWRCSPR